MIAGTVRANLALAGAHPDQALWDALADAALEARVRALPQGLDTWIGENGERLSGGERRRLCSWPAPCCATRPGCCWTSPPKAWTPRPRLWSSSVSTRAWSAPARG